MVGIILPQLVPREEQVPNTVCGPPSPSFCVPMHSPQPPRSRRVGLSAATGPPLTVDELKEQHGISAIDYAYHSKLAPVPALIHRQAQPSIDGSESSQQKSRSLQRVPTEIIDENSQQSSQGSRLLARNLERSPHRIRYPPTTAHATATPGPSNAPAGHPPSAAQIARPQHASPSPLRFADIPIRLDQKPEANELVHMDVDDDVRPSTPTPVSRLAAPSPLPALTRISATVSTPPSTPPLSSKHPLPISRTNSLTRRPSLTSGSRSLIRRSSSSHVLTGHPPRYYLRKRKTPATPSPIVAPSSQEAKPKSKSRTRSILRGGVLKGRSKKKAAKS